MTEDFIEIGRFKKSHGLLGEVKFQANEAFEDLIYDMDHLFVFTSNQMVPFFIEAIRSAGVLMKLEGIDNPEEAKTITNKIAYVQRDDVPEEVLVAESVSESTYPFDLGYIIIDTELGVIGEINQLIEMPMQILAEVIYKEKEVLIPLNDYYIQEVNQDTREIFVQLPEGLLNL